MAIGIGDKTYNADKITESNGSAFVFSGESFEKLKKNTLSIKTEWPDFDGKMNLMFDLATLTMDNWTATSSEIIKMALADDFKRNQTDLAKSLNQSQSNVSRGLTRGGFYEIKKLLIYYRKEIKALC